MLMLMRVAEVAGFIFLVDICILCLFFSAMTFVHSHYHTTSYCNQPYPHASTFLLNTPHHSTLVTLSSLTKHCQHPFSSSVPVVLHTIISSDC